MLIRLRKCAGWSESLLGRLVRRYVFLHCDSNICYYAKTGEPVQETIDSTRTEESYTAPVKKKKKKPVIEEQEPDTWRSEEEVTTPKSVDEVQTPKKKKKKKPVSGETEDEALSPTEDIVSPKGKKKKKKTAEAEGKTK